MAAARVAISKTLSAIRASSSTAIIPAAVGHVSQGQEMDDAIARLEAAPAEQTARSSSLVSVLTGSEFLEPFPRTLTCKGSKKSHVDPPNLTATTIPSSFLTMDLVAWNKDHSLELEKKFSKLRATIGVDAGKELYYKSEADVQHIAHLALQDATSICNAIIETKAMELGIPRGVVLETRLESPLFSITYDHVVVYDSISGTSVFVVVTKKPWDDGAPAANDFGQVFDQLMVMSAWGGHKKPYGALTSFDSTYIVWLNKTPSEEEGDSPSLTTEEPLVTTTEILRKVYHSERFESHEMVSAFVSAILRSLNGV